MTPEAYAVLSAAEAVAVANESGWSYVLETRLQRLRSAVIEHRVATRRQLPAGSGLLRHADTTLAAAAAKIRARSGRHLQQRGDGA